MMAMTAQSLESERGKRRHKPARPPEKIPGAEEIDCTEDSMASERSPSDERRFQERDSMVDRRAGKQYREDAKKGCAGHIAPVIAR